MQKVNLKFFSDNLNLKQLLYNLNTNISNNPNNELTHIKGGLSVMSSNEEVFNPFTNNHNISYITKNDFFVIFI